jgi:hypothetical protein
MELAQDRVQWQALLTAVLNLLITTADLVSSVQLQTVYQHYARTICRKCLVVTLPVMTCGNELTGK